MKTNLKQIIIIFFKLIFIIIFLKKNNDLINYKPKLKILLCTVVKEENKYILEFVKYYQNMKFNKIIIYDNNEKEGENLFGILKNYIKINFVKIIDIRGLKRPQKKAFNHCYNYNKYHYEWIAFYDIDEYLYLLNYTYINDFLSLSDFKNCQSIVINWKYYGDNDKLFYESKPLKERFIKPINFTEEISKDKYIYSAAKSIVRGGLYLFWGHFPHYIKNVVNCRPNGTILNNYHFFK